MSARETLLAALAALAVSALVFAPPLFGGRATLSFDVSDPRLDLRPWVDFGYDTRVAINPASPDLDVYVVPGLIRLRQLAAAGAGPWWDGSQLLGYPLGANLPYPVFHPAAWALAALEPVTAVDVMLWLHTGVGGLLAYRCARRLGASRAAGALGAAGFALSGWMVARWHTPHLVYSAAWWPGLLAAAESMRRGRLRRGALEGAVFGALALVSGFPQVAVYMLCGFVAVAGLLGVLRRPPGWVATAGAVGLAVAIAWPQLAVSGDAYAHSLRSSPQTRRLTAERGLPPAALVGVVLPRFFGHPPDFATRDPPAPTIESWLPQRLLLGDTLQNSVMELALQPGALLLLLLPLLARRDVDARARRLGALALGALALCLLWPVLARAVPALSVLAAGNVKRLLVLAAGTAPIAGALAFDALRDRRVSVPWWWLTALVALLVAAPAWAASLEDPEASAFAASLVRQGLRQGAWLTASVAALLAARRSGRGRRDELGRHRELGMRARLGALRGWLAAAVLGAELAAAGWALNPFPVQREPFAANESIAALATREGRIAVLGSMNVLPPPAAAIHGLRSVHGAAPMVPARTAELLACIEGPLLDPRDPRVARPFREPASLTHPLLALLGADTVVLGDPEHLGRVPGEVVFESRREGLAIVDLPGTAAPRARLFRHAAVVTDAPARLALLARRDAPLDRLVLVEQDPPAGVLTVDLETSGPAPAEPAPDAARHAALEPALALPVGSTADDAYGLAFDAPWPGIAVLCEAWDPGWRATVDGMPAEVLVADHALLAVAVDAGPHEVVFRYAPPRLRGALRVTGLAAAVLGLLVLAELLGLRARPAASAPPGSRAPPGDTAVSGAGRTPRGP